jgi:TRAP-type C4-dicarboxylate transport system permease small subunit
MHTSSVGIRLLISAVGGGEGVSWGNKVVAGSEAALVTAVVDFSEFWHEKTIKIMLSIIIVVLAVCFITLLFGTWGESSGSLHARYTTFTISSRIFIVHLTLVIVYILS